MNQAYYNLFIALEKNASFGGKLKSMHQAMKDKALSAYIKVNHSPILRKLQKPGKPPITLQHFGGLANLAGHGTAAATGGIFRGGGGMFGGAGASGAW